MPSCQARGHSSHCGYTRWWSSSRPGAPCSHNTPRSWKLVMSLLQVYKTHVIDGLPIKPTKLQPTRHLISLQLIVDSWQSSKNLRRWMRHLKLKCQNQNVALCLWSDGENARRFSPVLSFCFHFPLRPASSPRPSAFIKKTFNHRFSKGRGNHLQE